ncbi:MAG: dTDP-4-dehydrorhamnose 3,5-epimerase [Candidatus Hodarchaeales archaeon]|jgi:dTDP-4-dehydrorhamnose 3,5-epimerase
MKFSQLPLYGAWVIQPETFKDPRGIFARIFCQKELRVIGHQKDVVQINHSLTRKKGTVRGMHYQSLPMAEIKIIFCLHGSVFDVIVDLRKESATFLKWHGEVISRDNMKIMYAPEGFAHGFQALEENSELLYMHTNFYSPEYEGAIRYNDPKVNIRWPLEVSEISEKDQHLPFLADDFRGICI